MLLLPLAVLSERRRQGCWFAIELPPEVSGPAADATQQGVCLQLAVDAAFAPDNTGILAQEHSACSGSLERVRWYRRFRSRHSRSKKGLCSLRLWVGGEQGGPAETAGLNRHPEA